jgi:hypothetical protein
MREGDTYAGEWRVEPALDSRVIGELQALYRCGLHFKYDAGQSCFLWDGCSEFTECENWMRYLINYILAPKGYVLNGKITWHGPGHPLDAGYLRVVNNQIKCGMLYI